MVLRDSWRHISVLRIRAVPMIAMPAQILAPLGQYALSLLPINKELAWGSPFVIQRSVPNRLMARDVPHVSILVLSVHGSNVRKVI
jgi:hypothetical protein